MRLPFVMLVLSVAFSALAEDVVILHHGDPIPKDGVICQFENDAVREEFVKRIREGETAPKEDVKPAEVKPVEKPVKEEPKEQSKEEKKVDPPKAEAPKDEKKYPEGAVIIRLGDPLPGPGISYAYDSDESQREHEKKLVPQGGYKIHLDDTAFNVNACKSG